MMAAMHILTIKGRLHRLCPIAGDVTGGGWLHKIDGWYTVHATAKRAGHALRQFVAIDTHDCVIGYTCCAKACGVCGKGGKLPPL